MPIKILKRVDGKKIGNLIFGKKYGVVGLCRIGKMVAEMFLVFGTEIVSYDLYLDKKWAEQSKVKLVDIS